jgi:glycosyltransferase involved in cell wall biosynthesis
MLRILFAVNHTRGISGPHRNVVGSLNALARRSDVELTVLTGEIDASEPWYRSERVRLITGFRPKEPRRIASNVALLRKYGAECDVLYIPTNLTTFLLAQSVWPRRCIVAGPNVAPLRRAVDAPGKVELALCERWLEASDDRRDKVLRFAKGADDQVVRIYHAIDSDKFSPAHRDRSVWGRHQLSEDRLKVTFVGRDNAERKGLTPLLDAMELLGERRKDFDLVLVGKLGEATQERARRLGNAHCLGFQTGARLPELLASSDIVVVPSRWENMAFVVLEAMASGVAIVASAAGGIVEQIEDGKSGLLVKVTDSAGNFATDAPRALAEAVERLLDDAPLRARLGQGARQRALDFFNEQRLGQELVQTFLSAIGSNT